MNKLLLILTAVISLSACNQKTITEHQIVDRQKLGLERPSSPVLHPLTFHVITPSNIEEKLAKHPSYVGISMKDYENLAVNLKQVENFISESNLIIDQYQEYYEGNQVEDSTR